MTKRQLLYTTLICTIAFAPLRDAQAFTVIDPANLVQNILQAITTVEDLSNQYNQLTDLGEISNLNESQLERLNLSVQALQRGNWAEVQSLINDYNRALAQGQALIATAGQMMVQFDALFPGYQSSPDYQVAYAEWSQVNLDTQKGAMNAAARNISDAGAVQADLDVLRSDNNAAVGQLSALQTGNRVASLQVEELTKLRALMVAQLNAQAVAEARHEQAETQAEASTQEWVNVGARPATPRYRINSGFSEMPALTAGRP